MSNKKTFRALFSRVSGLMLASHGGPVTWNLHSPKPDFYSPSSVELEPQSLEFCQELLPHQLHQGLFYKTATYLVSDWHCPHIHYIPNVTSANTAVVAFLPTSFWVLKEPHWYTGHQSILLKWRRNHTSSLPPKNRTPTTFEAALRVDFQLPSERNI